MYPTEQAGTQNTTITGSVLKPGKLADLSTSRLSQLYDLIGEQRQTISMLNDRLGAVMEQDPQPEESFDGPFHIDTALNNVRSNNYQLVRLLNGIII